MPLLSQETPLTRDSAAIDKPRLQKSLTYKTLTSQFESTQKFRRFISDYIVVFCTYSYPCIMSDFSVNL